MAREKLKLNKVPIEFLQGYKVDRKYLLRPDRQKGKAGIREGETLVGEPVLIKVWPRKKEIADNDLEDIWRNEVRQLHRLTGALGATSNITELYDAGYDSTGFYLVLQPELRRPLPIVLQNSNISHWTRIPKAPTNRRLIWQNISRLVVALDTLHSQGLLHRNIDQWAVLTTGSSEADFQLTGFEWSMRVVSDVNSKTPLKENIQPKIELNSFLHDWKQIGILAADLLGINSKRLTNNSIPSSDVAEPISAEEIKLLRELVQVHASDNLEGKNIENKIDGILTNLNATISNLDPHYNLVLSLGLASSLSQSIREASDLEIEIDDIASQIAFVQNDLSEEPLILGIKNSNSQEGIRIALKGRHLIYPLKEFSHPKSNSSGWEYAFCNSIDKEAPASSILETKFQLTSENIHCLSLAEANIAFPKSRGKSFSWEKLRKFLIHEKSDLTQIDIAHRALTLIQLIDSLFVAADVYPIEIVENDERTEKNETQSLNVKIRKDDVREKLSQLLKINPPFKRFKESLVGDGKKPDGWILTDSRTLGDKNITDTEWKFVDLSKTQQGMIFQFSGEMPPFTSKYLFLMPLDFKGNDTQFRRILKALNALRKQKELLKMLVDPRSRIRDSHDVLDQNTSFLDLDEPKKTAILEMTSTMPIYLVQGPPGVGKTKLVGELVRRRFQLDNTSRILLSAQSNPAVDHLMEELESILQQNDTDRPLIVRSVPKEPSGKTKLFSAKSQAVELVKKLSTSKLSSNLPASLLNKLDDLNLVSLESEESESSTTISQGRSANQAYRHIERLIVSSANMVFATTNSLELERLIDERSQFDWTIVEEAGKATGSELVSPLLLSHRRLMIGDHKQLPAFSAEKLEKLLISPESVEQLLTLSREILGVGYKDSTIDEIFDEVESNDSSDFPKLCSESIRLLTLFENTIEKEFDRKRKQPNKRSIATKLTEQHRMHPTIATLVSSTFYDDDLDTHPDCIERFNTSSPPFDSINATLIPKSPIVLVDMPYIQSQLNQKVGESHPRWTNNKEVDATIEVLKLLKAKSTENNPPTLALLSPYNQQRIKLSQAITSLVDANGLLNGFRSSVSPSVFCHTVDSFQGSEADLVIVSLVRNNQHSNIRSALGFLCDERRMNVLFSRAKWKMILITSSEFLNEVVNSTKTSNNISEIKFMKKLLENLEIGRNNGSISFIPYTKFKENK